MPPVSDQKTTVRHQITTVRCHNVAVSDQMVTVSNLKSAVSDRNLSVIGQIVTVSDDISGVSAPKPAVSGAIATVSDRKWAVSGELLAANYDLAIRPVSLPKKLRQRLAAFDNWDRPTLAIRQKQVRIDAERPVDRFGQVFG